MIDNPYYLLAIATIIMMHLFVLFAFMIYLLIEVTLDLDYNKKRHNHMWRQEHLIRDYLEVAIEELVGHDDAEPIIKEAIRKARTTTDSH